MKGRCRSPWLTDAVASNSVTGMPDRMRYAAATSPAGPAPATKTRFSGAMVPPRCFLPDSSDASVTIPGGHHVRSKHLHALSERLTLCLRCRAFPYGRLFLPRPRHDRFVGPKRKTVVAVSFRRLCSGHRPTRTAPGGHHHLDRAQSLRPSRLRDREPRARGHEKRSHRQCMGWPHRLGFGYDHTSQCRPIRNRGQRRDAAPDQDAAPQGHTFRRCGAGTRGSLGFHYS